MSLNVLLALFCLLLGKERTTRKRRISCLPFSTCYSFGPLQKVTEPSSWALASSVCHACTRSEFPGALSSEVWGSQVVARARVRARGEEELKSGWEEKHHRPHTTREQRLAWLPGAEPRRGRRGPGPPARPPAPHLAREAGHSALAGSPQARSRCKHAPFLRLGTMALFLLPRPESLKIVRKCETQPATFPSHTAPTAAPPPLARRALGS